MIIETNTKAAIKTKLMQARENITSYEEALDLMVDAIYEVIAELLSNATVTGICPPNGGALQNGKIT
jgi:hypothetical protein